MLSLVSPKRLLAGNLAGAMLTSVTYGMVLVFTFARIEHIQHGQAHRRPDRQPARIASDDSLPMV